MPIPFQKVDDTALVDGPARVLMAPYSTAIPTKPGSAIDVVSPYAPKVGYTDLGHTVGGVKMGGGISKDGNETDQSNGNVRERITGAERSISAEFAQITPAMIRLANEGSADVAVAATANNAAGVAVDVGTPESLSRFRIVVLALMDKDDKPVPEPGGITRGAIYARLCFRAELAGESSEIVLDPGELAVVPITFNLFPDPADASRRTFRDFWETPSTISAV